MSLIIFVILIFNAINYYPLIKNYYSTGSPFFADIGIGIVYQIISAVFIVLGIFTSGVAGNYLAKDLWPEKIVIRKKSIFIGYLLALFSLGITSLIYFLGEKYLGVWGLGDSTIFDNLLTYIPLISLVSIALYSSISEELVFRLFGISFFKKYIKSTIWAVLITTIIWAVAHSNYPVFPYYFRAIELLIGGLLFGYFFVRYDISTTITAHYIFNSIVLGLVFFVGGGVYLLTSWILVLILPLLLILWKEKK